MELVVFASVRSRVVYGRKFIQVKRGATFNRAEFCIRAGRYLLIARRRRRQRQKLVAHQIVMKFHLHPREEKRSLKRRRRRRDSAPNRLANFWSRNITVAARGRFEKVSAASCFPCRHAPPTKRRISIPFLGASRSRATPTNSIFMLGQIRATPPPFNISTLRSMHNDFSPSSSLD